MFNKKLILMSILMIIAEQKVVKSEWNPLIWPHPPCNVVETFFKTEPNRASSQESCLDDYITDYSVLRMAKEATRVMKYD